MKYYLIILFLIQLEIKELYSQSNVSIYAVGDSITNCEINFKNLRDNWFESIVINAKDYELQDYSFIETISDSTRYRYYRNYFASDKPLQCLAANNDGYTYKQEKKGIHTHSCKIEPLPDRNYLHASLHFIQSNKEIPEDFKKKVQKIIETDYNIDTMHLNHFVYESKGNDTTFYRENGFVVSGTKEYSTNWDIAYPDSLPLLYIGVEVKRSKNRNNLSIKERHELMLEELVVDKIRTCLSFNDQVNIGDKVYKFNFKYKDASYSILLICSGINHKLYGIIFLKALMS